MAFFLTDMFAAKQDATTPHVTHPVITYGLVWFPPPHKAVIKFVFFYELYLSVHFRNVGHEGYLMHSCPHVADERWVLQPKFDLIDIPVDVLARHQRPLILL